MSEKVWFITGCSSGFGRVLADEILKAGDRVVATARKLDTIEHFAREFGDRALCLSLDVTKASQIKDAVARAEHQFGRIDVLVNNAGFGAVGALEEFPADEIRRVFDTNVFGLIEVTKAVLPGMRKRKSGHILNISSIAGIAATPGFGVYNATKFAVEGLSESLAGELAPLGIKITIVEPGPFRTDFAGRSIAHAQEIADYHAGVGAARRYIEGADGNQAGDPVLGARLMMDLVNKGPATLRLPMGKSTLDRSAQKIEQLQKDFGTWKERAIGCDTLGTKA